jgi:hypothetical protein
MYTGGGLSQRSIVCTSLSAYFEVELRLPPVPKGENLEDLGQGIVGRKDINYFCAKAQRL